MASQYLSKISSFFKSDLICIPHTFRKVRYQAFLLLTLSEGGGARSHGYVLHVTLTKRLSLDGSIEAVLNGRDVM